MKIDGRLKLYVEADKETVALISGPISLDTANLTDRDITVSVIKKFRRYVNNPELHSLYQELCETKFSARGLTAKDLMLKDAKCIESPDSAIKAILSTIHDKLENFLQREDAPNCIPKLVRLEKCIMWVFFALVEKDEPGKPFNPSPVIFIQKIADSLRRSLCH